MLLNAQIIQVHQQRHTFIIKRLIPLLLVCSLLCTAGANAQSAFGEEPGFGPAQQEQPAEDYWSTDEDDHPSCEAGNPDNEAGNPDNQGCENQTEPIPIKGLYLLLLAGAGYGIYRLHQPQ